MYGDGDDEYMIIFMLIMLITLIMLMIINYDDGDNEKYNDNCKL